MIPSDEMMIVPELPTETNNPEVVSSLLDPQLTLQGTDSETKTGN